MKREYQQFLQERNRGRADGTGRPDREPEEIEAWARERGLPFFDGSVHFPDARIEYEDQDRQVRHEDIEVVTEHYRGAHAAGTVRSGFRSLPHRVDVLEAAAAEEAADGHANSRSAEEFLG